MTTRFRASLAALAATTFLVAAPAAMADNGAIKPQTNVQALPNFVTLVKQVKPAVVSITAHIKADVAEQEENGPGGDGGGMQGSPFPFPFPFQMMPQQPPNRTVEARGSGFIISADGYVVTNNHVVNGATKVTVTLDDGTTLPAKIIGRDPKTDVALLRVKPTGKLPFIDLGDSDEVQPGEWVIAVGNPYGLGGTVTAGIVSALGRDLHSGAYNDFIQVDAPINHGNSGGPLFTQDGKVVGINSMIISPNGGGSIGIGFAIPSNTVRSVVDQLEKTGHVTRGYFGIEGQDISPTMAQALNLKSPEPGAPPHGTLVASVSKGSPAEKAGIKSGDVILTLNGHPVKNGHDLAVKVVSIAPGTDATVNLLRDGKPIDVKFTVGNLANQDHGGDGADSSQSAGAGKLGVSLASLTPRARQELGLDDSVQGAVVADVVQGSPADQSGIRPGDIIVGVGNHITPSPKAVVAQVKEALGRKQPPLLRILRDGQQLFVAVSPDGSDDSGSDDAP
ncbi:endopeptidase DegP/Do [Gluconobacter thailandicus F149-1 = NBRC 100600]|uniref:Endopeptidase DegP/Do n=1 Tax=Gluconobacter thailandicus NBRC 3257 TaxID=1381097 RepID=A0ABQ0IV19_GLUTH|nr:Do family serine endopeptidase [Gluconobacter thailandicus]KXV52115.1 endopeptidase [Gluconobacter thailandicus]GAC86507.1 endopeptidase DegP/Do [Gluconobacter thailandicus NBRC 3255]GAD26068.1 endopeptidase DegP/Do [Gluconobacter thailandicus NBRC 3257]GAN93052.1 endopeptidase DegP/Do [Gluconobacter thailandicus F149-1 = NBRC 100600]GBR59927.1 endopeptidase DegP/Do [Gluconobacter thailandicus F149-1 = NBRC 100600]